MANINRSFLEKVRDFFNRDIWRIEKFEISKASKFFLRQLGLLYLAFEGFIQNKCPLRASALTYTTLLSLVPLLAVMFFIFQSFGGLQKLEAQIKPFILENLATGSGEVVNNYISIFIEKIHSGAVGAFGIVSLIIVAVALLGTIEKSLNVVWGVSKHRSLFKKFSIYWSVITLGPLFISLSIAITASLQSNKFIQGFLHIPWISRAFYRLLPFLFTWLAFTFLYIFMPNTNVRFTSGFVGAVVGGTLWEIAKWGYTIYASKMVTYANIYGSLGAIPIFLIWIYLSWLIVLLGAEFSFAHQNLRVISRERRVRNISVYEMELLGLEATLEICRNFDQGNPPITISQLVEKMKIPIWIFKEVLTRLVEAGIIVEYIEFEPSFHPAKPPEKIRINAIFDAIIKRGEKLPEADDPIQRNKLREVLQKIEQSIDESFYQMNMKELMSILENHKKEMKIPNDQ